MSIREGNFGAEHVPQTPRSKALKKQLFEEFNGRCAYCSHPLGHNRNWAVDCFVPPSVRPDLASDPENLLPVCVDCNIAKGKSFPMSKDGAAILVNPRTEKIADHIRFAPGGLAVPLTERGTAMVNLLDLNSRYLEFRQAEADLDQYFQDLDRTPPDSFRVFLSGIEVIKALCLRAGSRNKNFSLSNAESRHLMNMLYGSVVSAMEAYLGDTLVSLVLRDQQSLRRFVETFVDFRQEQFSLAELFSKHDGIRDLCRDRLRALMYHNLPKVAGVYRDACGVDIRDFGPLMRDILVRHDIVHRNGKTKDGGIHSIDASDVAELCKRAEALVRSVNTQVESLRRA